MHRYIDDIFLTSNQSLHAIDDMLDEVNHLHPNIKLVRQVGTSVSFLDVRIENRDGIFSTFHMEQRSLKLMLLYNGFVLTNEFCFMFRSIFFLSLFVS